MKTDRTVESTVILSFSPKWFPPLANGAKKFEYRKSFAASPITAYLYLTHPVKQIVARIRFGKRFELTNWLADYSDNTEILARVTDYLDRNKWVIPVLEYQEVEPVSLAELYRIDNSFRVPRLLKYLTDGSALRKFLDSKEATGNHYRHEHLVVDPDDICVD